MLWSADGGGRGVRVDRRAADSERIATVADQVQEWAIEELWGTGVANRPPCPHHQDRHPLRTSVRDGTAVWVCPADDAKVSPIGAL